MWSKKSLATCALVATIALAPAACSSSDPAADSASPTPVRGGQLVVAQPVDAQPGVILAIRAGNLTWAPSVFETLVLMDPSTLTPEPLLASSWEVAADGMFVRLHLQPDVTFHTGRPMTAEDVKFSLEKAADPEMAAQVGFIARSFESITVVDEATLDIVFTTPLGSSLFDLLSQVYILDAETFAGLADGSQIIGTGPYEFAGWTPGSSITLTRYADYRDADVGHLDGIEFEVITDPTAMVSALRSGRAQIGANLSATDISSLLAGPGYTSLTSGGGIPVLGMNVTVPPFDNPEVRQAIGYAIDRERILDQALGDGAISTDLFWSPSTPGYTPELANHFTYDPDKAKQLIDAAGATGAVVPISYPALPTQTAVYEIVQNNLEAVGLEPQSVALSVAEFDQKQTNGELGAAFVLGHGQVGLSAATMLDSLPSLREGNPSGFWNDEYERLRDDLRAARDEAETASAVEALSTYLLEQAFSLPFGQTPNIMVVSDAVSGVTARPTGGLLFGGASLVG